MQVIRLRADRANSGVGVRPEGQIRAERSNLMWNNPQISLEEIKKPSVVLSHEVSVQVSYCGICGSDFLLTAKKEAGSMSYSGLSALPVVLGHEFSGMREDTEELVAVEESIYCGECVDCHEGREKFCKFVEKIGFTKNGAYASHVIVPKKNCWSLASLVQNFDADTALRMGALIQPYAISYSALFGKIVRAWLPGDRVLIPGAGPIGFATADLALAAGAAEVAVVEPQANRAELVKNIGVDYVCS